MLLISQFWTLANDVYDPRQAKRLFGFIGGGASLGGAIGAGLTRSWSQELGTNTMLLVSAAILARLHGDRRCSVIKREQRGRHERRERRRAKRKASAAPRR